VSNLESRLSALRIVRHSDELLQVTRPPCRTGDNPQFDRGDGRPTVRLPDKSNLRSAAKEDGIVCRFLTLQTLGLQLHASIAPDFEKRMAHRLERRRLSKKQVRTKARKNRKPPPDVLTHRCRLGGIARGRKVSAERLSEIGRTAVNARWQRYRER
jgi:hypothetical protein